MTNFEDDRTNLLLELELNGGLPAFVKEASFIDDEASESLQDSDFADAVARRFPVHDAASTFLSALEIEKAAATSEISPVARDRLAKSVALWGVGEALDAYRQRRRSRLAKVAAMPPEGVRVTFIDAGGGGGDPVEFSTVARDASDAAEIVDELVSRDGATGRPIHSRRTRRQAALSLARGAEKLALPPDLEDRLQSLAGLGFADGASAADLVDDVLVVVRARCPEMEPKVIEAASGLTDCADEDFVPPDKCARLSDIISWIVEEIGAGVEGLPTFPEEVLHRLTPRKKLNMDAATLTMRNGAVLSRKALADDADAFRNVLEDVVGGDAGESPENLEDALRNLTEDEANEFRKALDDDAAARLVV